MSNSSTSLKNLPTEVELLPDKIYFWCTCSLSSTQPFCDGAHKGSGTGLRSLPFSVESPKKACLCNCKRTKTPPYCDGSHNEL